MYRSPIRYATRGNQTSNNQSPQQQQYTHTQKKIKTPNKQQHQQQINKQTTNPQLTINLVLTTSFINFLLNRLCAIYRYIYLRLYGIGHIVKDLSKCKRKPAAATTWVTLRLAASVLLYAPSHIQDSIYHGIYYTSRGALAGTSSSSMGPTTHRYHNNNREDLKQVIRLAF